MLNTSLLYETAKHFTVTPFNGQYAIGSGSQQKIIKEQQMYHDIVDLAHFCLTPRTQQDLTTYLDHEKIHHSRFLYMLDNFFITPRTIDTSNKYSRNHIYFETLGIDCHYLQHSLACKHILIVGCGGIGNALAYSLALLGVKKLTLLDTDTIESSNLNRQFLFTEHDLGKPKASVLRQALLDRNSSIEITAIADSLSGLTLKSIQDPIDCILLSADDDSCLPIVNHFCVMQQIPYLNVGYLNDISIIGPFYIPKETACMVCHKSIFGADTFKEENPSYLGKLKDIHQKTTAPSATCNNFMAASMAMIDLLYYFNGEYQHINSFNKRVGLNNRNFSRLDIPIYPNRQCSLCSTPRHLC